ncbi:MAG: class II aldolase/adducin family protein [Lachnospiraceae bacterium]|nr:class II aldolase/adducin family protein [Lachnospiraceae bacterium]
MDYKTLIVESGLRMAKSGLTVSTYGNISARDPNTQLVYLTPSGMPYNTITQEDIVVTDIYGNIMEGHRKPTVETPMHTAIFRAREDINAVIHTHALYSTVFAAKGESIPLIIDEAAQMLCDEIRCTPKHEIPGSDNLSEAAVKALGDKAMACLLNSHGAICVGNDMEGAFTSATVLEMTAQILYMIEASRGVPCGIPDDHILYMQDYMKNSYGQR